MDQLKTLILKLHKEWDAIPDNDVSLDGFKNTESIENDVQHLILDYCEKRKYTSQGLSIGKLKALYEEDEDELFPYDSWLEVIEQIALNKDDVAELLWFYHHTFWPEGELWGCGYV